MILTLEMQLGTDHKNECPNDRFVFSANLDIGNTFGKQMYGQCGVRHHMLQRAREINQLAVSFGCIMVVAQPHNPKTAQQLGRFRVQFPGCTVVQQNQLFWFLWVNAAETPIRAS